MKLIMTALILICSINVSADEILDLVNSARFLEGGGDLALSSDCQELAQWVSEVCIENNEARHWGGMQLRWDWLRVKGINYLFFGEVVGYYHKGRGAEYMIDFFRRNCPAHWDALMNERFDTLSYSLVIGDQMQALTIILLQR